MTLFLFLFSLTLLCRYPADYLPGCTIIIFLRAYPAVPLSCWLPFTRLYSYYFSSHLPCRAVMQLYDYHLPGCVLIFLRTYPAVPLCNFMITAYPAVSLFFYALTRTLWCPYFTFAYPAVPLFFCALTLLCSLLLARLFLAPCALLRSDNASPPASPTWCRYAGLGGVQNLVF